MLSRFGLRPSFCIITSFILFAPLRGQAQTAFGGGRAAGLCQSVVSAVRGPEAVFINPSCLSICEGHGAAFFTANPFGLKELGIRTLSFSLSTPIGGFGIALEQVGNGLYQEQIWGLAWGIGLHARFAVGTCLRYTRVIISRYGEKHRLLQDLSSLLKVSDQFSVGFAVFNLLGTRLSDPDAAIPQVTRLGMDYRVTDALLLTLETLKDPRFPLDIRCGCEMRAFSFFTLRCGFSSVPRTICAGIGMHSERWVFDYAFSIHSILGSTHQASLTFQFRRPALSGDSP